MPPRASACGLAVAAVALLSACVADRPATGAAPPANPPAGMQYLYGSGKAAALSVTAHLIDLERRGLVVRSEDIWQTS